MNTHRGLRSAGEVLREARESAGLTLEQVSAKLHIRLSYLESIEQNDVSRLPKGPFRTGYVRAYADLLELDPDHLAALFRRDHAQEDRSDKRVFRETRRSSPRVMNPSLFVSGIGFVAILLYVVWQINLALRPPRLVVFEPLNQQQVVSPVRVLGEATPDVILRVNDRPITLQQFGGFQTELTLSPGEHMIIVEAKNRRGKSRFVERSITVVE